ncbi:MAG: SGNH/GDSL hydrolase family protein [Clostridia bacterium]|nr:SGNH/GDSL hydrolase family protein [Clostridia bacterium]
MYFAGVKAGKDTELTRTPDRKYYVQFVGDSISDATNSFSHNSADIIDWDYSTIACEALSLVKDMGYWRYNNGFNGSDFTEGSMAWHFNNNFGVTSVGMEDAFFKLGIPNKWDQSDPRFGDVAANYYTEKYDFNFETGYTPDIVFIFLGTNDLVYTSHPSIEEKFVETYKAFVAKIFELYGKDTEIVVMQALSTSNPTALYDVDSSRYKTIRRVAEELTALYPDNVTFLDENTLFSWGVDISPDNTHPSADGYATLSTKVAQWLKKTFK